MDGAKIIVDRNTGDVLSGHHRLKALKDDGVEITEEMIEYVGTTIPVIHPTIEPIIERDAYGRAGERYDCDPCGGTGVQYGETCLTCGGFGWWRSP